MLSYGQPSRIIHSVANFFWLALVLYTHFQLVFSYPLQNRCKHWACHQGLVASVGDGGTSTWTNGGGWMLHETVFWADAFSVFLQEPQQKRVHTLRQPSDGVASLHVWVTIWFISQSLWATTILLRRGACFWIIYCIFFIIITSIYFYFNINKKTFIVIY